MSLGRAVPWVSWDEWHQVRELLQSSDARGGICQGLDRVAAWRARGRIPLGVDLTAQLLETSLSDKLKKVSEVSLRLEYSLAVVRLVNGITDSSQRGRVATSVASLAGAAGLPRLLVDLRHEATHNELPSLASLRLASLHALRWLQDNYWERQAEQLVTSVAKLDELVLKYVNSHINAARKAAASSAYDDSQPGGESPPPPSGTNYDASTAKKQRQALLTELGTLVPRPSAALLVTPALSAAESVAQNNPRGVVLQALIQTARHLQEAWPQLGGLILEEVARRLGKTNNKSPAMKAVSESLIDALGLWVDALLAGVAAPATARQLSEHGARSLLSVSFGGYASLVEEGQQMEAAASGKVLSVLASRLIDLSGLGKDLRRRCLGHLGKLDASFAEGGQGHAAEGKGLFLRANDVTSITSALNDSRDAGQVKNSSKRGRREYEEAAKIHGEPKIESPNPAKWQRCATWQACAIGALPSQVDPNGQIPKLEHAILRACTGIAAEKGDDGSLLMVDGHIDAADVAPMDRRDAAQGVDAEGTKNVPIQRCPPPHFVAALL